MSKTVKIILIVMGSIFAAMILCFVLVLAFIAVVDKSSDNTANESEGYVSEMDDEEDTDEYYDEEDYEDIEDGEDDEKEEDWKFPTKDDLTNGGITWYLENLDAEQRQAIIDKAVDENYPVNWPVLWIVVKRVNADAMDQAGKTIHVDVEMSDEESDYLLNDLSSRFVDRIGEYTNGLVNVEVTPLLYDEVNYLDMEDDNLLPESFKDIKDELDNYNSVICIARYSDHEDCILAQDWLGLAISFGEGGGGYGFCQVKTADDIDAFEPESLMAYFDDNPVPEEGCIHEWLHTFQNFETVMQDCDGNPDCAQDYGYECLTSFGANGFYEYYRDLLNGDVWSEKKHAYIGMNADLWRTYAMLNDIAKGRTK